MTDTNISQWTLHKPFTFTKKKLWLDIYGADYFDYSESSSRPDSAKVTHIPWWQFANLSIPIPDVDVVTINHALCEMHPTAVKIIFARLYAAWGDNNKKLVLAESLGYDYFKRKNQMFSNIRSENFVVSRNIGHTVFHPNQKLAEAQSTDPTKASSLSLRVKNKATKRVTKLVVRILRNQIGQRLAELINRGPIHQNKLNSAFEAAAIVQTQPLHDFFENLVADERTPDEIFLKPINGDIK